MQNASRFLNFIYGMWEYKYIFLNLLAFRQETCQRFTGANKNGCFVKRRGWREQRADREKNRGMISK